MATFRIRAAGRADLGALERIYDACFPGFEPPDAVARFLAIPDSWALLATAGRAEESLPAAGGFAIARSVVDEAEMLSLGVDPSHRGRGVGRLLVEGVCVRAAAAGVRSLFLEVGVENWPARALYTAAGFEVVGERRDYYRLPSGIAENALVMRFKLDNLMAK